MASETRRLASSASYFWPVDRARSQPWMTSFVQRDHRGHLARQIHAAGPGHPLPGGRIAPCRHQHRPAVAAALRASRHGGPGVWRRGRCRPSVRSPCVPRRGRPWSARSRGRAAPVPCSRDRASGRPAAVRRYRRAGRRSAGPRAPDRSWESWVPSPGAYPYSADCSGARNSSLIARRVPGARSGSGDPARQGPGSGRSRTRRRRRERRSRAPADRARPSPSRTPSPAPPGPAARPVPAIHLVGDRPARKGVRPRRHRHSCLVGRAHIAEHGVPAGRPEITPHARLPRSHRVHLRAEDAQGRDERRALRGHPVQQRRSGLSAPASTAFRVPSAVRQCTATLPPAARTASTAEPTAAAVRRVRRRASHR